MFLGSAIGKINFNNKYILLLLNDFRLFLGGEEVGEGKLAYKRGSL